MWYFMLCVNLLTPIIMISFGYYFMKKVPAEINEVFGYRTTLSMMNNETWKFANHYAGKLWFVLGSMLVPITMLAMAFLYGESQDNISELGVMIMFFQLIPLCIVIVPTEIALRKRFDKNGNRKA